MAGTELIKGEIVKKFSREAELDQLLITAQRELASAESRTAASVADGADVDENSGVISKAAAKVTTLKSAIVEVRRQRGELIGQLRKREAMDHREKAALLRKQSAEMIQRAGPTIDVLAGQLGLEASVTVNEIIARFGGRVPKLLDEARDGERR